MTTADKGITRECTARVFIGGHLILFHWADNEQLVAVDEGGGFSTFSAGAWGELIRSIEELRLEKAPCTKCGSVKN
jgi:hypothetical protein